jgi:hypothetical protein
MDAPNLRPRLATFRVLAFNAKNNLPNVVSAETGFELSPTIEVAFAVPASPDGLLEALVNIRLQGRAALKSAPDETIAEFSASYEARYFYPVEAKEADVAARFERETHQYMLVAQAYPLASSHFRRELMAMGFTVDNMPLGI